MKNSVIILFCFSVLLMNCQTNELLKTSISKKKEFTNLILENAQLKVPFKIINDSLEETGAIFFETAEGKTWLKGNTKNNTRQESSIDF